MSNVIDAEFGFMSEMERYDAFLTLYHSRDPKNAEQLEALLNSPDPLIPLILGRFLEELPDKRACLAIIKMIEGENGVVAKAAMDAYSRSHYPGKARLLKSVVFSPSYRAARFAIRTLARAGFMDVLPLILREIPDKEGPILKEMVDALRYLPHRRSIPVLLPLSQSDDEAMRYLVVDVLASLQARTRAISISFFLAKLKDESDRVRRAALDALQKYPTSRVAPLILKIAQDKEESEGARVRAIRSMRLFPSPTSVRNLTQIAAETKSTAISLTVEIVLRQFPVHILKKGLLPMLDWKDAALRRQTALFMAEFLAGDSGVQKTLHDLWRKSDELAALEIIDSLRILGGPETVRILMEAVERSPVLAYSAASALAHMHGSVPGLAILNILIKPGITDTVRHALLDRWAKRGPEKDVREQLLSLVQSCLKSATINIRYSAAQILGWYPIEDNFQHLFALLKQETNVDIINTVISQISRGLGRNPVPFMDALRSYPSAEKLIRHAGRVLLSRGWDKRHLGEILDGITEAPLHMQEKHPNRFAAVCVHLVEHGTATLQDLWPTLQATGVINIFLKLLIRGIKIPTRPFPILPLAFLELQLTLNDLPTRILLYDLMACEGRAEAAEFLAAALLREEDPQGVRVAVRHLKTLMGEGAV